MLFTHFYLKYFVNLKYVSIFYSDTSDLSHKRGLFIMYNLHKM